MNLNIETAQYLEELLEVCTAREHCYKELLNFTEDQFCRTILTRYVIQSEVFREELLNASYEIAPFQFKKTMITSSFVSCYTIKSYSTDSWSQIKVFESSEEIEKTTVEWYESILQDIMPVPLNIIISQQLKDIKMGFQKVLFLKQALRQR